MSDTVTQAHLVAAVRAGVADVETNLAVVTVRVNELAGDVDLIAVDLGKRIDQVQTHVSAIAERLDAKPLKVFIKGRVVNLVDKVLPLAVVAAVTWAVTHSFFLS